jgi:peptide/nickel transport system substrate-binding protein
VAQDTEIHKALYSGPATQDPEMRVVPNLAVSWRTLDSTHWEFKLRPGVVFHDGAPLTADDIVFTYTMYAN